MTTSHSTGAPSILELSAHLDSRLRVANYPDEQNGLLRSSNRPVRRIGIALDVRSALTIPHIHMLDALLLHRWWEFESIPLDPTAGVLGYHLPFDHRVTVGENPYLAERLGLSNRERLHDTRARAIGMLGNIPASSPQELTNALRVIFGGLEHITWPTATIVTRIAVVGAMTASLVQSCSDRGADMYVTGQLRQPALAAVAGTGIGVVAVGHARAERLGLRCLRDVIRQRWPDLEVVVALGDGG